MRLLASTGELVPGRCRSSNLCDYCARLAAVETAEMLALDALESGGPEVWCVLTTPRAELDPEVFREARRQVRDAVRARWSKAEFAQLVEFTTGYGPLAGGLRRPHWNLLVKGVPAADVDELRQVVVDAWCTKTTRARRQAQYVGRVDEVGGLMRYLALHFQKQSQQPPRGWHGHRFSTSRGYLVRPASVMREEARASLRLRRELWKARRRGLEGLKAEEAAAAALEQAATTSWRMLHLPTCCLRPPLDARRRERPLPEPVAACTDAASLQAGAAARTAACSPAATLDDGAPTVDRAPGHLGASRRSAGARSTRLVAPVPPAAPSRVQEREQRCGDELGQDQPVVHPATSMVWEAAPPPAIPSRAAN